MAKRKERIVAKVFGYIIVLTSWDEVKLKDFITLMKLQEEENKEDVKEMLGRERRTLSIVLCQQ